MAEIIYLVISGVAIGFLYGLVAAGFALVIKATGVFNLAQGELMLLGALICYTFLISLGLPLVVSVLAAVVIMSFVGLIINRAFITPLTGQPLISIVMVTIVLGLLLRGVCFGVWAGHYKHLGFTIIESSSVGGVDIPHYYFILLLASIICFAGLGIFLRFTRAGLILRATSMAHQVARSVGIKVTSVFSQVWVGSAVLGAVAGILVAVGQGIDPELYTVAYKVFPVLIIGGVDSILGVMIAGPIVGFVEQLSVYYLDPLVGGGTSTVVPFIILLIVLMVKPYGLMGLKEIERI